MVVDGLHAFTGGMNVGDRHLVGRASRRGPVLDVHFQVEGPVVADPQRVFLEDWFFATGELHWVLLGALACARCKVQIMTPYFIPDPALTAAMGGAALRGVEVDLLLPGTTDHCFMGWATRSYLWELLPLGVRVRYQPPPFVHTKLFLVDEQWCLVGSANSTPAACASTSS